MPDSQGIRWAAVAVLGLLVSPTTFAGPDKVPARLTQARYVALAYDLGDSLLSETEALAKPARVLPEDREALNSVRNMIEEWGRYVITVRPEQAELVIAVRAGRRASLEAGVRIGGKEPAPGVAGTGSRTGSSYRGEVSSRDDMLSVYDGSTLIWRAQRPGGLSGRSPTLFEDLKADVERATKRP
jgi:plasmid stabilization system protein ParE